jgi:hypothetical protein
VSPEEEARERAARTEAAEEAMKRVAVSLVRAIEQGLPDGLRFALVLFLPDTPIVASIANSPLSETRRALQIVVGRGPEVSIAVNTEENPS